jgi:hypothetical protein
LRSVETDSPMYIPCLKTGKSKCSPPGEHFRLAGHPD